MSFYLRQSIGFFLQIFPCVLLCFVPFHRKCFRWSYQTMRIAFIVFAIISSIVFPFCVKDSLFGLLENMSGRGNIYMLLVVSFMCTLYFYLVKEASVKKILVINLTLFYATTQYMVVNLFYPLFPIEFVQAEVYATPIFWLFVITTLLFFPIGYYFMNHIVREYLQEMNPNKMTKEFRNVQIITVLYLCMMLFYATMSKFYVENYWWLLGPPFLFVAAVLTVFYWNLLHESLFRQREDMNQRQLQIQQLQYKKIIGDIDTTRRLHHDMRHQLRRLYELLKQGQYKEMEHYLETLEQIVHQQESERFCKDSTLNSLLQYYIGWAREEDIDCSVDAYCDELVMDSVDLTSLIGNVLENAIHACQKIEKNRWIHIQIGMINASLAIQVDNSCDSIHFSRKKYQSQEFLSFDAFQSSDHVGNGLKSMDITAKKYGGSALFCYDEEKRTFTTRIRLNLNRELGE